MKELERGERMGQSDGREGSGERMGGDDAVGVMVLSGAICSLLRKVTLCSAGCEESRQ